MLSELAAELLPRCDLPSRGELLSCAVSGGPDSLALLVLAVAAGCDATAYHVDHGLRPESDKEAAIVQSAADRLGARFIGLRVEVAPGGNLEARARAARFSALPPDVATGHTADDQAETIILNLARGSGASGLAGMRAGRRHPILKLRRSETERLVSSLRLDVVRDPSNADPNIRRNRVRHELIPLLSSIADRDVVAVIGREAELIADDVALLDEMSDAIDATDARQLADAPVALARRSVRAWLRALTDPPLPPDSFAVERVLAVARGETIACEIAGGTRISRHRGRLVVGG
ncbi:MAG TPA: tRNA lysidine(34) synthetase TilS [Acidimicrobiales bacterium]|nr:tRNA lysidine(34) synthetase TilS [Acidimicrobiales bacterium]